MSRIYMLGGTANAGKTTCAARLAVQFGLESHQVDTVRVELQASAPNTDPIRYFSDCSWLDLPPENSLEHKIDVARRTCQDGVAPLMARLLIAERDAIIEGDDLPPEFVEQWRSAGASGAVFLIEADPDVIRQRYLTLDRTGCIGQDHRRLDRFISHYLGWVRWLQSEAAQRKLTVVDSRGGDVFSDVAAALGLTAPA